MNLLWPGERIGAFPGWVALRQEERPIEEISEMGEDLNGGSGAGAGGEIGEALGGAAQRFSATVGDGCQGMPEQIHTT